MKIKYKLKSLFFTLLHFQNKSFLTLSNKVEKCLWIRFVCLSVRPSVHALTLANFLQMFFKFIDAIYTWYRMGRIENVISAVTGSSTGAHNNFPMHYGVWEENFESVL